MLASRFNSAFEELLTLWRRHDDLRQTEAAPRLLADSRVELERARDVVSRVRRAWAPEARELEEVAFVTYCDTLESTVLIHHRDADRSGPTPRWLCVCGRQVGSEPSESASA